jgi:hypothetical protein
VPSERTRRRQHVISAGYQRLFAPDGRITYIDKLTSTGTLVGVKDAFVEKDFNSWNRDVLKGILADAGPGQPLSGWDDSMEKHIARLEAMAVPAMRRLSDKCEQPLDRWRAAELAAMHIARSYSFQNRFNILSPAGMHNLATFVSKQPDLVEYGQREYGRPVCPEEDLVPSLEKFAKSGFAFVNEMRLQFEHIQRLFSRMTISVAFCPPGSSLLFGDSPVLYVSRDGSRVGMGQGVMLGEAHEFVMPISRTSALWIHSNPSYRDTLLHPDGCKKLNGLEWHGARRFVACHPDDDPSALLNRSITLIGCNVNIDKGTASRTLSVTTEVGPAPRSS